MAHTYLAPWDWDAAQPAWQAPNYSACRGTLDLRPAPKRRQPGGSPGYGLFAYDLPQAIAGALYLGPVLDTPITPPQRVIISQLLGVPVSARSLRDLIIELTSHPDCTDPTGEAKLKPCGLARGNRYHIRFARETVIDIPVSESHPVWQATLAVRRLDYRRNKDDGLPLAVLRRWTGYDMLKLYGRMGNDLLAKLLPGDCLADGYADPRSTVSDNFNRADEQLDASANWTTVAGTDTWANVVSNQLEYDAADSFTQAKYRHEGALSSDEHYGQITVVQLDSTSGKQAGVCVRFSSSAETAYFAEIDVADNRIRCSRVDSGSRTNLDSDQTLESTPVPGDVYIEVSGSGDIVTKHKGVTKHSFTDTGPITGNVRAGLHFRRGNSTNVTTLDDFIAEDLSAGGAALTISKTDAVTVGEAVTVRFNPLLASVSDAVTVGETVALRFDPLLAAVSDAVTVGETVRVHPLLMPVVSDAVTIGESVTVLRVSSDVISILVSDAVTVGEAVTLHLPVYISVSDAVLASDATLSVRPGAQTPSRLLLLFAGR